jgi:hypothetical protein
MEHNCTCNWVEVGQHKLLMRVADPECPDHQHEDPENPDPDHEYDLLKERDWDG